MLSDLKCPRRTFPSWAVQTCLTLGACNLQDNKISNKPSECLLWSTATLFWYFAFISLVCFSIIWCYFHRKISVCFYTIVVRELFHSSFGKVSLCKPPKYQRLEKHPSKVILATYPNTQHGLASNARELWYKIKTAFQMRDVLQKRCALRLFIAVW